MRSSARRVPGRVRDMRALQPRSTSAALSCAAGIPTSGSSDAAAATAPLRSPRMTRMWRPSHRDAGRDSRKKFAQFSRKSTCATPNRPAGRRRVTGLQAAAGGRRKRTHPRASHRVRNRNTRLHAMRNAFFYVLCEIAWGSHRCSDGGSDPNCACGSGWSASDGREAHPKKICSGLLTCRKTVIRFRPADDSCGIE